VRRLILTLLVTPVAAILLAACTADLKEGCLTGGCPSMDSTSAAAGTSGGTGTTGGGGGSGCGPLPATGPCHVDPPKIGAPFPILTYADTQMVFDSHGKLRYQRMHEVIQDDGAPHMPYKSKTIVVPPLTPDEFKTLDTWTSCANPTPAGMGCGCPGPMGCTPLP
jgi:hypothetical protein